MRISKFLILLTLAGAPVGAAAQPERARWISRWDRGECQLIRAIGNPPAERLAVKVTPGSNALGVWVSDPGSGPAPRGTRLEARLVFAPSGARFEGDNVIRYRHQGNVVHAVNVPEQAYLDAMAAATALRFEVNGTPLAEIPLGNAAAAVDVLRQCMNDQLRTWGIDPGALAALSRRPQSTHPGGMAGYFSNADYPSEALRGHYSGATTVRVDVSPEGRVTGCATLASSGHRSFDDRTCIVLSRRARFEPALDAAGTPTAAPIVAKVRWNAP